MIITASTFSPFETSGPHVALRFPYDAALVDQLKRLGRQLRPQTLPDSAVGWLAEHRASFVHPAAWLNVFTALTALGHTVVGDIDMPSIPPPPITSSYAGLTCIHCGQAVPGARVDRCGRCLVVEQAVAVARAAWTGEKS
jgi:hypothetical protein